MARAQLAFTFASKPKRKRRQGAKKTGPKPRPERVGFVAHRSRDDHEARNAVHVTMRCVARAPSLRAEVVLRAIGGVLRRAIRRGIQVVHYSIQGNHIHLIAEGADKSGIARGMQWLFSRIAFEVNRVAARSGSLFRDRHHRHELETPSEMRRALVYVLMNGRKHLLQQGVVAEGLYSWIDPCSSAAWLPAHAWRDGARPSETALAKARAGPCPPAAAPATWLVGVGWKKAGGALRLNETPAIS